ncbi:MAG: hypothetical protein ACK5PF_10340 [bacterium]
MASNNPKQTQSSSMSSPPSPLVWFLLLDAATGLPYKGSSADKVSVSSSADVADFRKAVQAENASILTGITSSQLLVYKNKAAFEEEKEVLEEDSLIGDFGTSKKEALIVVVPLSTSSSLKPFRQKRYKAMCVEASCLNYLDAIALKLSIFYDFDYKNDSGPTIGDVFAAKDGDEGDDWSFRRAKKNYQRLGADGFTVEIRKGQPFINIKLPDIYTTEEWTKIKKFNYNTSERIHSGNLPSLSNGRPYIVIPHAEFTPEMISFLKTIGVKASLFSSPDVLEVKDEDVLSEGSSFM